jgi:hypothetical protein
MKSHLLLAGSLIAVAVVAFAGLAHATVPVMDSAVIASSNKIATNTAEQLKRLNDIKKTTEDILESLGQQGQGQYDLNKNQNWKDFSGGGAMVAALKQFAPNTGAMIGNKQAAQKFATLADARKFIMTNLYTSKIQSNNDQKDFGQARKNAEREANVSAYSLALVSRQYLASSQDRAKKLDEIVNGADDVRGDLRANSAVLLAQHDQLTSTLAMLTSMLERDAASYIASEKDIVSPEGGNKAPGVYNPKDYTSDGIRVGVSGSASGQQINWNDTPGTSGGSLSEAAKTAGNADAQKVFQSAQTQYGADNSAVALGALGAASSADGNAELGGALNQAASGMSGGNLSGSLFSSAASIGSQSSNENLQWMSQSAQYGVANNAFQSMVSTGDTQQPMIDAMFNVAQNMASSSSYSQGSTLLSAARQALQSGTINENQAAMVALQVASSSAGQGTMSGLLQGAQVAASGGTSQQAILSVMQSSGSQTGSNVASILSVLSATSF